MSRKLPDRDVAPAKRETSCQSSAREIQPAAARHLPLWNMVVTPASVPEFIIPSLGLGRAHACGREKAGVGNGRRHTIPRATQPSSLVRALAHCCPFTDLSPMEDLQTHALSDPTTRAAMSLPHLSKITTPYGFLTLGESPCVRRRESLFFEENAFQECLNEAEHVPCLRTRGGVKSLNKTYTLSKVGNSKTVRASGDSTQIQNSSDSSELLRPACISCGLVVRKGWIKLVHRTRKLNITLCRSHS